MSEPSAIILDCDPGHDDAIALLLAHGSPAIDLLAVTTVAGNQTLQKVTRNAQAVAAVGGFGHVPVAAGCSRPLVRPLQVAAAIHGESGLDGPVLPAPVAPLDPRHAVDELLTFFAESYAREQHFDAPPVHDPVAVAAVIDRSLLTTRRSPLEIELTGTATLGMTVADRRRPADPAVRTEVALAADTDRFWALVLDALQRIG